MRYPALQALIIFVLGILLFIQIPVPSLAIMFLAIIATSIAVIYRFIGKNHLSQIALCFAILFAAGFCTGLRVREFPSNHIIHFTGLESQLTISGEIVSEPDIRPNKTFLRVRVDSLEYHGSTINANGNIRVSIKEATSRFNYHDQIKFSGFLNSPSSGRNIGAFDYRKYLQLRNVFGIVGVESAERIKLIHSGRTDPFVRGIITPVRDYISNVYDKYLLPEQSAVMKGFLIGNTRFIPRKFIKKFKDTGTLHVLAVSGANVGFVIFTLYLFLSLFKIPRYHRNIIAIIAVLLFSFLAYNQPSVVRASVMAITALTGRLLYRDIEPLNIISFPHY